LIGLLLQVACLIPLQLTPETLSDYQSCRVANRQVSYVSDWAPLVQEYFEEEDVHKALRVIYCESSGIPTAYNQNKNGSNDAGLFQFNNLTWDWLKPKLNIKKSRYDAETNIAVASWLVYNDSWKHWNASKECWNE